MKDQPSGRTNPNKVEGPVFDFSTTRTQILNFAYDGPKGCAIDFDVYAEYPFETNAEGQQVLKAGVTPIENAFTDNKGGYNRPIVFPSYVRELYINTSYPGVTSRLLVAKVTEGGLSAPVAYDKQKGQAQAKASTRAGSANYNAIESDYINFSGLNFNVKTLTLGKWYTAKQGMNPTTLATGAEVKLYGRPVTMSYVDKTRFGADAPGKNALAISSEVYKAIRIALPGDNKGPVDPKYLQTGDIHVKKDAELDLIFIQNWGAYRNTLAYYCYPTANPPKSVSDIKYQVVAIPNAMEQKFDFAVSTYFDLAAMYPGEGVKLKYVDQNGQMADKFPAGTSVGWVLYRDGYSLNQFSSQGPVGAPTAGRGANFSSMALTQHANTAVLRVGDYVAIGFDDGEGDTSKRDYLDVMFNVQATPSDAITEDVPEVEDPNAPQVVKASSRGILLFEDLWPFQGDFDMNDVVVGYVSNVTKNGSNAVVAAEIDFTIMHSGATQDNSFAYYDPNIANATITITNTGNIAIAPEIDRTNNIIRLANKVLSYANAPQKVTFTVKYEFKNPVANYTPAPFNPFITLNNEIGKEVHMTNYPPTAAADLGWFSKITHDFSNPALGLYYITFENLKDKTSQQLPFAVNIVFDSKEKMNGFKITQERERISDYYPEYKNWVKTNGKESQDWYLYHAK